MPKRRAARVRSVRIRAAVRLGRGRARARPLRSARRPFPLPPEAAGVSADRRPRVTNWRARGDHLDRVRDRCIVDTRDLPVALARVHDLSAALRARPDRSGRGAACSRANSPGPTGRRRTASTPGVATIASMFSHRLGGLDHRHHEAPRRWHGHRSRLPRRAMPAPGPTTECRSARICKPAPAPQPRLRC